MTKADKELSSKIALVSGGSRGIGRAIALELARMGCNVSVLGRDASALAESVAIIEGEGAKGQALTADLREKSQVEAAFEDHMKIFGRIDVLVNNAAAKPTRNSILDVPLKDFETLLRVNVSSYFQLCQLAGRDMRKRGWGRIINIASTTALKARPMMGDYAISKAGELMLTRQFAAELGEYGITVNAIAPTLTRTDFSDWQWQDEVERDKVLRNLAIKRVAEPEDTSKLAAFLASNAAGMITGTIIPVDGGSMA